MKNNKFSLQKAHYLKIRFYIICRNFSSYNIRLGALKNLMIEQILDEEYEEYDDQKKNLSPYGANPARFSYNDFNSQIFFHCIFKHLKANYDVFFMISLRSDKQHYFHGGISIDFFVYDPNDIRESHYLFGKIIYNITSRLNKSNKFNNNILEENGFYFNYSKDTLEEIQILYIYTKNSLLKFEITDKYPYFPIFISKNNTKNTYNSQYYLQKNANKIYACTPKRKIGINKWFEINYKHINSRPNNYFLDKYLVKHNKFHPLDKFRIPKALNFYFYQNLYHFKNNNIINTKNYISYLKNIPDNLLLTTCQKQINYYYNNLLFSPVNHLYYSQSSSSFKYGIVSLYLNLGNKIVLRCLKYLYSQYLINNNIKLKYDNDYNLVLLNTTKQNFLSFTEFKNKMIIELIELETNDIIELGRDIYLFTIFNLYLSDLNSKIITTSYNNKSLISTFPININYLNGLYPSRNKINKIKEWWKFE